MKTKTSYTQNYSTFAGEIDIDDFSTETPNKQRINKYIEADNLEKTIIEKERQKKEMKNYQSMTLEELREIRPNLFHHIFPYAVHNHR